jgi:hypothetical protein
MIHFIIVLPLPNLCRFGMMGLVAEHLICCLLLAIGHGVVERLEGRSQLLHVLRVAHRNLTVRLQILGRGHAVHGVDALLEGLVHTARVISHHVGKRIPLWLLRRCNAQLGMHILDPLLDCRLMCGMRCGLCCG